MNSELCIPTTALEMGGEDGQNIGPTVGDEVEVTIAGKVTRSEGGQVYIQPSTANGQPMKTKQGAEADDYENEDENEDEDEQMRRGLDSVSGVVMTLLILGWMALAGPSKAADLEWARDRICSGGAVSNYVAAATPKQVFFVEANNFTGGTLYLLVYDSATNQLNGAAPHVSAVPVPSGLVGGKMFGSAGAPFVYGVNVCLSQTPFSLTNANGGGTVTITSSPKTL